jgi:phosphate:Na+ symporter
MDYSFFDFLKLIGALGFFLFGMKLMSESLQKVAGDKMRAILAAMTANKYRGVLTGLLITAIIQSSSATTVMVVSFVNAGLLTLVESIGVIMGANIGTTITAWLISILGFKVDINIFALPLIGLSIPLIFSKSMKNRSWGEFVVGFSIIFMGLVFLKDSVPDINSNPQILNFFSRYSSFGYWSVLFFLLVGTVMTMIIQSSSAAMALTLVMCYNGWINFEMAAAMVMGQNIGTTITANLAALVANSTARQAARAHFLFNFIGVILVLIVYQPFVSVVLWFCNLVGIQIGNDPEVLMLNNEALPLALSVFHTVFNVLNTLILIWFVPQIAKLVRWMVPNKEDDDEKFELKYIKTGLVSVDEISTLQVKQEIVSFIKRTEKMYEMVKELYLETKPKNIEKLIAKIRKYEEIADKMDEEIASFLTKITSAELSKSSSETTNLMLRLVSRIESINDSCSVMAELIYTKSTKRMAFTPEMDARMQQIFAMVDELMGEMVTDIATNKFHVDVELHRKKRDEIEQFIEKVNMQHLKDIKKGVYKYKTGIVYCDIFSEGAVMGDHIYHALKYMKGLSV